MFNKYRFCHNPSSLYVAEVREGDRYVKRGRMSVAKAKQLARKLDANVDLYLEDDNGDRWLQMIVRPDGSVSRV